MFERQKGLIFPLKLFYEKGELVNGLVVEEVMAVVQNYFEERLETGWTREELMAVVRMKTVVDGVARVVARMKFDQATANSREEGAMVGVDRNGPVKLASYEEPSRPRDGVKLKNFVVYQAFKDGAYQEVTVYRETKAGVSCRVVIYFSLPGFLENGIAYALRVETAGAMFGVKASYPATADCLYFDADGKLMGVDKDKERGHFV